MNEMTPSTPEVWLQGPLPGVPALLQPIAHALLQAREEVRAMMNDFPEALLWERPAEVASPAFHLQHLTGVLDRLFTYARNESLSIVQRTALAMEGKPDINISVKNLITAFEEQIEKAVAQLKTTDAHTITEVRGVGRDKIPSTVIGLLTHAAEHTMRHTGQLLVTVKMLRHQASSAGADSKL